MNASKLAVAGDEHDYDKDNDSQEDTDPTATTRVSVWFRSGSSRRGNAGRSPGGIPRGNPRLVLELTATLRD